VGVHNMGGLLAQNIILTANLVVGVIALVFLVKYVRATKGIEKAAIEQSEGLSKPALALRAIPPRSPTIGENFVEILKRQMLTRAEPTADGHLELINTGNGPALRVSCEISDVDRPAGRPWIIPAAYVRAGETLPLPLQNGNPIKGKRHKITCSYHSLSWTEYASVVEVGGHEGDEIAHFSFGARPSTAENG
jgi:hypothetical protein